MTGEAGDCLSFSLMIINPLVSSGSLWLSDLTNGNLVGEIFSSLVIGIESFKTCFVTCISSVEGLISCICVASTDEISPSDIR